MKETNIASASTNKKRYKKNANENTHLLNTGCVLKTFFFHVRFCERFVFFILNFCFRTAKCEKKFFVLCVTFCCVASFLENINQRSNNTNKNTGFFGKNFFYFLIMRFQIASFFVIVFVSVIVFLFFCALALYCKKK